MVELFHVDLTTMLKLEVHSEHEYKRIKAVTKPRNARPVKAAPTIESRQSRATLAILNCRVYMTEIQEYYRKFEARISQISYYRC